MQPAPPSLADPELQHLLHGPLADLASARRMLAVLGLALAARGRQIHAPPPEPSACCGRGCHGCVWEGWYAAVRYWREQALQALQAD